MAKLIIWGNKQASGYATRVSMSQQFRSLSAPGRAYVTVVSAIGLTIAVGSLAQVFVQQVNVQC